MKLLHIDASILGPYSISREVSAAIVARLTANNPDSTIVYRDLANEDLPHLRLAYLPTDHPKASMAGPLDAAAQAIRDESQRMLDEFLAADTVVIGVPMYNFGVPSQLKAWIDRVIVPGKTFKYGATGVEGLAAGKRVLVALARGGFYGPASPTASAEHAESYIRSVFGFIGVTDLEIVIVEGVMTGEEAKAAAVAAAHQTVERLAA
jgi:FMN-dependent NADH-azoreductase